MNSEKPVLLSGHVYKEVLLRDGKQAVLRVPDWHDVDDFLVFINAPPSREGACGVVKIRSPRGPAMDI